VCVRANPSKPRCQCTKTLLCTSGAIFRSIKTSRATSLGGQLHHYTAVAKWISRFPWLIHVCFIRFFPMLKICLECTCWLITVILILFKMCPMRWNIIKHRQFMVNNKLYYVFIYIYVYY